MVSQSLKGKIRSGKHEMVSTRPKKRKEGAVDAVRQRTGLTNI